MLLRPQIRNVSNQSAQPYCQCYYNPVPRTQLNICSCGEDIDVCEWRWERPAENCKSWVLFDDYQKQVTFHPVLSSGTAAVRGDRPFIRDQHYYWEIKMLSETCGTDIMVGVGTDKVDIMNSRYQFTSLLGEDENSYGLSYRGAVRHGAARAHDSTGFCRGSIVGVRLDMWLGTLEFYINRKTQGIKFYNLRRHKQLYPIICSTTVKSTMRLIYAGSWQACLLVDAAKVLSASVVEGRVSISPRMWWVFKLYFWLLLPVEDPSIRVKSEGPLMEYGQEEINEHMDRQHNIRMIRRASGSQHGRCTSTPEHS